jgi:hypothetical protein
MLHAMKAAKVLLVLLVIGGSVHLLGPKWHACLIKHSGSRGQAANNVSALEAQLTHQVTLIEQQRNKIMELETQAKWYSTTLQRIAGEKEWAVGTVKQTSPAATARSSVQKTAKENKTAREIRRAFCTRTRSLVSV